MFSGICVLNALSIDDDKTGFTLAFVLLSRFFDQFFLRLDEECCCLLRQARSISESMSGRCAIWESHGAAVAIGNLFLEPVHNLFNNKAMKARLVN